jgi:hypothetical protein
MSWIVLLVVLIIVLSVIPAWPYSRGWGYGPMGALMLILTVLLMLKLFGKL